jgi:hypothetical protein
MQGKNMPWTAKSSPAVPYSQGNEAKNVWVLKASSLRLRLKSDLGLLISHLKYYLKSRSNAQKRHCKVALEDV